ncbi:uncharacterized protein CELE_T18D3.5 [Caenorhabditis elegans]|uniref:Secreted protein n=1 Tax=Caenorhabditis elegans TaxID=6239 RepID=Q22542_CAEEL|nr:Secreted protein [Caenorhabditis elegans]CAA92194.1 Secreted protein [Caenorhabditis elegans]|eukprot:NP_510090.1 Uncharacterized protein CELE_T18D3.5 [Caenorhabditis elegans]
MRKLCNCLTCLLIIIILSITLANAQDEQHSPRENEASRDNSDVWLVVILCLLFCFALRHMNDFYVGESVTLVAEGEFSHRFSRKQTNKHLERVEKDFNDMFQKLCEKYERDLDSDGCCDYYEENKPSEKIP